MNNKKSWNQCDNADGFEPGRIGADSLGTKFLVLGDDDIYHLSCFVAIIKSNQKDEKFSSGGVLHYSWLKFPITWQDSEN